MTPELSKIEREYETHCEVINRCDWPRFEKRKIKKRLYSILKRDGKVDLRAFEPSYRWNLCTIRLESGDFTNWDGWQFRSDWLMTFLTKGCPVKRWDGATVKRLVVLGEQGLGDEILFLSALPDLLVRYGKGIEFVGYESLNTTTARSFGIKTSKRRLLSEVVEGDAVMCSGDLFEWYRRDKSHFPRKAFLKPDPAKVEIWKEYLKDFPRPWVGLGWYSRHGYVDPNELLGEGTYFDLQYRKNDMDVPRAPESVIPCPFDFKDSFEDLFAFVKCLDKVVSSTQTLVHVAGAVGTTCEAIIPPKNNGITNQLWYHHCKILGGTDSWPHLVYGSVKVYKDLDARTNRLK